MPFRQGSFDVATQREDVGSGLAITFSQPKEKGLVRWELLVDVTTGEGVKSRLGRVLTLPPVFNSIDGSTTGTATPAPSLGNVPPSRIAAIAWCPGALGWRVTGRAIQLSEEDGAIAAGVAQCDVTLASHHWPDGAPAEPGVWPVNPMGNGGGRPIARYSASTITVGAAPLTVLPEDGDRVRAILDNVGTNDLLIGGATDIPGGYRLRAGRSITIIGQRAVAAVEAAAASPSDLAIWIDEG